MSDHFRAAERLIKQADHWLDADHGWKAAMSTRERLDRRKADFLGAIAHAVTGVLEALTAGGEPPLDDLMGDAPDSVPVPLLNLPMRDDRKETTP